MLPVRSAAAVRPLVATVASDSTFTPLFEVFRATADRKKADATAHSDSLGHQYYLEHRLPFGHKVNFRQRP